MLLVALCLALQGKSKPHMVVDYSGSQIIKKMHAAVRAGSPVTGTLLTTGPKGQGATLTFRIMRPHLFYGIISFMNFTSEVHWTSSGFYAFNPKRNEYYKFPKPPIMQMSNMGLYGLDSLFADKADYTVDAKVSKVSFQGTDAYAVPIVMSSKISTSAARGHTIFVDAKTFLPLGFDEDDPGAGGIDHSIYKGMKWRAKLKKEDLEWQPPKDAKLLKQPG